MDSRNFSAMMDSPKGSSRKPFGEITNNVNHQTPLKEEQPAKEEEALTPLANLKMLIRVASETATPELPPPPKRELFREDSIDEDHDYSTLSYSGLTNTISGLNMIHHHQENFTPSPSSSSSLGPPKVSRKQKSLGLLCEKFMSRFPESVGEGDKCEIQLDDLAKQMATERRRIYDIVNVLEAVQMMTKVRLFDELHGYRRKESKQKLFLGGQKFVPVAWSGSSYSYFGLVETIGTQVENA